MAIGLSRKSSLFEIKKTLQGWAVPGSLSGIAAFWNNLLSNLNLIAWVGHQDFEILDFRTHSQNVLPLLPPFIPLYVHQGERAGFGLSGEVDAVPDACVSRNVRFKAESLVNHKIGGASKPERFIC